MRGVLTVLTILLAAAWVGAAAPDAEKAFGPEDVKTLPKIEPAKIAKRLIYENTFDDADALKDWRMEGPGVARVEHGRLSMRSACQPAMLAEWRKTAADRPDRELTLKEYFDFATARWGKKYPDMIDTRGRFMGGHIVYWCEKSETPVDYYVEYEVEPVSPIGLYIVFVSAHAAGGKSIFDPSLAKRNGVFRGYIKGDINAYHFSYFANWRGNRRGTANMRKDSGFYLVASGPDITFVQPDKTYKIGILKQGARIRFCIDDRVVIDYTDNSDKGGRAYGGGLVGLRQMIDAHGMYDSFRVYALDGK